MQPYDEICGTIPPEKTIIVSLHNFSQRTAFNVRIDICKNKDFIYPLSDYIDEFIPNTSRIITLEDIIDPANGEPNRASRKNWADFYSQDPHKTDAHITYVRLTFDAFPQSEEYRTIKIYKLFLDKVTVNKGVEEKIIVSKSIAVKV